MKRFGMTMLTAALVIAVLPLAGCGKPTTPKGKIGYAVGQDIGKSLMRIKDEVDVASLKQGLGDALAGKSSMTEEETRQVLQDFQVALMTKQGQVSQVSGDKNAQEGKEFLAKNAKEAGVVTTKSGLQYRVVSEGTGLRPKVTDKVKVHYRGTLLNGKEFDSSYKRNEPAVFPVNGVIPGWTEALQLMKVGSKYKVFVPSNLAYGAAGAGQDIGPNATLVFDVELLGIVK